MKKVIKLREDNNSWMDDKLDIRLDLREIKKNVMYLKI